MFREILLDLAAIGCAAALLVAFGIILFLGGYEAVEPSNIILYSEIGVCAVILGIAIERLVDDIRRKK